MAVVKGNNFSGKGAQSLTRGIAHTRSSGCPIRLLTRHEHPESAWQAGSPRRPPTMKSSPDKQAGYERPPRAPTKDDQTTQHSSRTQPSGGLHGITYAKLGGDLNIPGYTHRVNRTIQRARMPFPERYDKAQTGKLTCSIISNPSALLSDDAAC